MRDYSGHRDVETITGHMDTPRLASFASWIRCETKLRPQEISEMSEEQLALEYEREVKELSKA